MGWKYSKIETGLIRKYKHAKIQIAFSSTAIVTQIRKRFMFIVVSYEENFYPGKRVLGFCMTTSVLQDFVFHLVGSRAQYGRLCIKTDASFQRRFRTVLPYFFTQNVLSFRGKRWLCNPVYTGLKLNVHKTFRSRTGCFLSVWCLFNL